MPTGPDHYREAERLIKGQEIGLTHPDGSPVVRSDEPEVIALAQVHATLALAAATAFCGGSELDDQGQAWREVMS